MSSVGVYKHTKLCYKYKQECFYELLEFIIYYDPTECY